MRAARLHAAGDIRLHDEPDPVAGPGDELVRVTAVGLCGSDRHWFTTGEIGDSRLTTPLVLGHEIAGTIAEGPRRGTRVAVDPADPCGACDVCLGGRANLCPTMRFAGHGSTDGGLRALMAWPSHLLHPLPDDVADGEAALLEPLGVALHAIALAGIQLGMRVSVHGCGPIGLLLVQALRALGPATLVATDTRPHRVTAAREMGATEAWLAGPGEPTPAPQVDVAFEVAGEDAAVASAIEAVRPGGIVVLIGIPDEDRTSFPAASARRKELSLLLCRRMTAGDLPRAIDAVVAGTVRLGGLITGRFPLEDVVDAFAATVERRGHKVIVEPSAP
jgi:L-iditol 2-dehydrogenase